MEFHCTRCGFHATFGLGQSPQGQPCPACGVGLMQQGTLTSGFRLHQGQVRPFVPFGQQVPGPPGFELAPGDEPMGQLDYFANESGDAYKRFLQTETVYLGRFNKVLLQNSRRFSWLSPYTGNRHNQRYFTQAALARIAVAQAVSNGGAFPRLIEPFVGSGQVFLNACHWGPAFNAGVAPFQQVVGGDLNPYVVAAFALMRAKPATFVPDYLVLAEAWDENPALCFEQRKAYLDVDGNAAATRSGPSSRHGTVDFAVYSYIYVVNRCVHGSKLNAGLGATAGFNGKLKLDDVREREELTLTNACATVAGIGAVDFGCRDFEATCNLATGNDVVFMDCPFPAFTKIVPKADAANTERLSQTAGTYGSGIDDGAGLQGRIVTVTRRLLAQGTTVVLCNFANPGLVRAYAKLLWSDTGIPQQYRRWFTFTYCSPARLSEAYQLTILPGRGKLNVNDVPLQLRDLWGRCRGDDNFENSPAQQEYFNHRANIPQQTAPGIQDWSDIVLHLDNDDADNLQRIH